jgi:hypothetical protein
MRVLMADIVKKHTGIDGVLSRLDARLSDVLHVMALRDVVKSDIRENRVCGG